MDFNNLRKRGKQQNQAVDVQMLMYMWWRREPGEPEYQDLDIVSNGGYTEALPTFRANSNDSVTINFSAGDYENKILKERKSVDEEKCLGGDIKDVDGDYAENDDLETSQEDLAKLKKEVHGRMKLPIVIENRGESST
ncbi:hypothetical protein Btru_038791 [Bulinus truncatus]|nr:hypothetical protein Btru_038791 [Bulinus truncatus]